MQAMKMVAANGKTMLSTTACVDCTYSIQGHSCRGQPRGSPKKPGGNSA
jgi:hypothetical protein